VSATGVERIEGDEATVLVSASATVSNSALKGGQLRNYRLSVSLSRVDDRWLASDVAFVG
jgi:hypothetical protein